MEVMKCTAKFCVSQKYCGHIRLIVTYLILSLLGAATLVSLIFRNVIGNGLEKCAVFLQSSLNSSNQHSSLTMFSSFVYALGNFLKWSAKEIIFLSTFMTKTAVIFFFLFLLKSSKILKRNCSFTINYCSINVLVP